MITHSVMCPIFLWNITLYLVLELSCAHLGKTHEHAMLRMQLSFVLCNLCAWLLIPKSMLSIFTYKLTAQIMFTFPPNIGINAVFDELPSAWHSWRNPNTPDNQNTCGRQHACIQPGHN